MRQICEFKQVVGVKLSNSWFGLSVFLSRRGGYKLGKMTHGILVHPELPISHDVGFPEFVEKFPRLFLLIGLLHHQKMHVEILNTKKFLWLWAPPISSLPRLAVQNV